MKKILLATCLLMVTLMSHAQNEFYAKQGFLIGNSLPGNANVSRCMMSEMIQVGTNYHLYFTVEFPDQPGLIMYASSPDLTTWSVMDTVLQGVNDTTNREYVLGGSRVVKLNSGQYRMFYRCCQKYQNGQNHKYHIRSAISNDGINFTREGIRIENHFYNATSYFSSIGHSEFYKDAGGNMRALLSAKDSANPTLPDNIYKASSTDEGLTWSNFTYLYNGCHDPVVIQDSSGEYHAFFTHFDTEFYTATSPDGMGWPLVPDTLFLIDGTDTLIESGNPVKIADLGAFVRPTGEIVITSNYASAMGPWTEIAYYEDIYYGLAENGKEIYIKVYPNPSNQIFTMSSADLATGTKYSITDIHGALIQQGLVNNGATIIDLQNAANGVYYLTIEMGNGKSIQLLKTE